MFSRTIERLLLFCGLALCLIFLAILGYREIGSRLAVRSFKEAQTAAKSSVPAAAAPVPAGVSLDKVSEPDYSLWDTKRIAEYKDSLLQRFNPPVALLRIPKLHLEVAVFDGTEEPELNRGAGRIIGTARVGEAGNIGIAGHRDGFFRGLKDIAVGDVVTLESTTATTTYVVDEIRIVAPDDVTVLGARAAPSVTLVTCYPFYFSGSAPQRYIVLCSRREERQVNNAGDSPAGKAITN